MSTICATVAADHRQLLERIAPLGDCAEQLSIQLQSSFGPDDLDALAAFVQALPASHRYTVELRHHAFYDDPQLQAHVEQVLGEHDVEWIAALAPLPHPIRAAPPVEETLFPDEPDGTVTVPGT